MSGSLNKVMLIGNLGKDPEARHFDNGGMLVRFPLATSETYTNREGNRVDQTEWHNIIVQRPKLAEICERYLKKGDKVYLEGRLKTRQWKDRDGQDKYTTEVSVDNMTMLTPRSNDNAGGGYKDNGNPSTESYSNENDQDDDLPF